jgi:PEP-CTERM motif
MLNTSSIRVGVVAFVIALAPTLARADSIAITAGTLTIVPFGPPPTDVLHLEGPRGFTMDARNFVLFYDPRSFCTGGPECAPGGRLLLAAGASGSDFGAFVTIDGHTFATGMQSEDMGEAVVDFRGTMVAPAFTADHVSVFSPFAFFGGVAFPLSISPSKSVGLVGRGTARIDLALVNSADGPHWNFQRATYEFQAPDAVPEPTTLLLVGSGVAGCLMRRRRTKG